MIRLVLILLFLLIIWVLFFAKLTTQVKRMIIVVIVALFVSAVWYDDHRKRPQENLVSTNEVVSCGVNARGSYRSTFELELCFVNQAQQGTVRRIRFSVLGEQCQGEQCQIRQRVEREVGVEIAPRATKNIRQSLRFDQLRPDQEPITWTLSVASVKATP